MKCEALHELVRLVCWPVLHETGTVTTQPHLPKVLGSVEDRGIVQKSPEVGHERRHAIKQAVAINAVLLPHVAVVEEIVPVEQRESRGHSHVGGFLVALVLDA